MKVFTWLDIIQNLKKNNSNELIDFFSKGSALTIGGFDGPHIGHCSLFETVINYKKQNPSIIAGVVTFSFPPKSTDVNNMYLGNITTLRLKLEYLQDKGFDFVIVIDFSPDFSKMIGSDFLSILKDLCSMRFVAAGSDFRCGYKLDTGVAELSSFAVQNGVLFRIIDEVCYEEKRISSSMIRQYVLDGDLFKVNKLLGRPYTVDCLDSNARSLNDVTHLIARRKIRQVLPPCGVYNMKYTFSSEESYLGVLHVESNFLRLEIPPEHNHKKLTKIEFL